MVLSLPLLLLMCLHHGGAVILTTLPPEKCAPLKSSFHDYCTCSLASGDDCGGNIEVEMRCTKLPKFFVDIGVNDSSVNCLLISSSPELKTISVQGLQQFPNLRGLITRETGLNHIVPQALDKLTNLVYLNLVDNELTMFPHITNLKALNTILVSRNLITSVDSRSFTGLPSLAVLNLSHNRISTLVGRIFATNCFLSSLVLSNNPLTHISDEVFNGTRIQKLYLTDTDISHMPSPVHLRRALEYLYLKGSNNLKTFDFITRTGDEYSNKTFPFLQFVAFPYHAHCCQLKRLAQTETRSSRTARSLLHGGGRDRREAVTPDSSSAEMETVCVNLTSLLCLPQPLSEASSMNVSWFEDRSAFCSGVVQGRHCPTCLNGICPETCNISSSTSSDLSAGSGEASTDHTSSWDMACFSTITPTHTLSSSSGYTPDPQTLSTSVSTLLSSSILNPALQSSPIPEPTSSSQFAIILLSSSELVSIEHSPSPTVILTTISTTLLVNRTICLTQATPSSSSSSIIKATPLPEMPTDDYFDPILCKVFEVMAVCVLAPSMPINDTNSTLTPPTVTLPPRIDCSTHCSTLSDEKMFWCTGCDADYCNYESCLTEFPEFCSHCYSRKKRSLESKSQGKEDVYGDGMNKDSNKHFPRDREKRGDSFVSDSSESFEVILPNFSKAFICETSTIKLVPERNTIDCDSIVDNDPSSESKAFVNVSCTPEEDVFNPCESLLGESNGLRTVIWFVIIFALFGNGMVFFVFIGYSVLLRRAAQDMFTVHLMYFNLAMADFLMGIYLFIVAVVDDDTKGEFFLTDIKWRTSYGCKFAGFCAITSTVVSVYILLVITMERTYTIYRVFKRKKLTNLQVCIIMAVGWIFGLLVAMLPLLGVSDYNTVAICLPFNVEGKEDLTYVVTLLLSTGVAFLIIAVCYAIIFQQIYKSNKITLTQVTSRRTADIKITIRIFFLIFTNFICWFPIALLGLSAAFGKSLVHDLEFARWAMVFIFPINACLNPLLYSLTTRAFREHIILLLSKCGLCKKQALLIKNAHVGLTPSYSSNASTANSNVFNCLRCFSFTSQSRIIRILSQLHRSSSVMNHSTMESQQKSSFHNQPQQGSSPGNNSSSRDNKTNSKRRSSHFNSSGHSLLHIGFENNVFPHTTTTETAGDLTSPSEEDVIPITMFKITDRLGVVQEEFETPIEGSMDEGIMQMGTEFEEEEGEEKDEEMIKRKLSTGQQQMAILHIQPQPGLSSISNSTDDKINSRSRNNCSGNFFLTTSFSSNVVTHVTTIGIAEDLPSPSEEEALSRTRFEIIGCLGPVPEEVDNPIEGIVDECTIQMDTGFEEEEKEVEENDEKINK